MKTTRHLITLTLTLASLLLLVTAHAANPADLLKRPANPADAAAQAQQLLALLTPEERFDLASGQHSFGIGAIPRLGIPEIKFTDASAGIRIQKGIPSSAYEKTTAFPCTLALAATWSPELAAAYADAIGEELRAGGIHVLLGPGMDSYRLSVGGRNFEYLGEDPFLASRVVESYVRALQARGPAATLKHFIGNETEFYRHGSNSIIDERALHEIYLPPFKAGVDAGAWAVMTSYNLVNGEWAGQNSTVVNGLLRGQLGFQWLVMTDWTSVWDGVKFAASGNDLEKPAGFALRRDREKLLGSPKIDRMALSILKTCIAAGFYEAGDNFAKPELMPRWAERAAVARTVNDHAITLLQNNGILPLAASAIKGKVLVIGNCANRTELAGGGSGHVKGYDSKSCAQAMKELFPGQVIVAAPGGNQDAGGNAGGNAKNKAKGKTKGKSPSDADAPTDDQLKSAALVLVFPGFVGNGTPYEGEGNTADRPFVLPDDALIRRAVALNQNTVVCVIAGGGVEMDWASQTAAIIHAYYGGQTGAAALSDVLSGKTNPSGKLPFTIEKHFADSPGYGYDKKPLEISSSHPVSMVGDEKKAGMFLTRENKTIIDVYNVHYKEGVFTGYRWYDTKNLSPRFPFGHGLSYTQFSYSDLALTKTPDGRIRATFTLKNTGARAGDEVAQLYAGETNSSVPRPPKELKGFKRVTLAPGEAKTVTIEVDPNALGFWDVTAHAWKLNPGDYAISVGASSRDLPLRGNIKL